MAGSTCCPKRCWSGVSRCSNWTNAAPAKSTGPFTDSITEHVIDGHAAIATLRAHPAVDGDRIATCGLSQGATIAPTLAAQDAKIAAVLTFAGPVGRRGALFLDSMRRQVLSTFPKAAERVERLLSATRTLMEAYASGLPEGEIAPLREPVIAAMVETGFPWTDAEQTFAMLDTPQLRTMYTVGSYEDLQALRIPVLALFTQEDQTVEAARNAPAALEALHANSDAAVFTVAGYDHIFRPVDPVTGVTTEGWPLEAPEVLEMVAGWLGRRLQAPAPPPPASR